MRRKSGPKKDIPTKQHSEFPSDAGELSMHSKDRLLKAAFEVFARKGFYGATTKLISNVAGVNESLITRHFQTKLGLFLSVIEKEVIPVPNLLPYLPQENFSEELACYAEHLFVSNKKNADLLRILIGQGLVDSEFNNYIKSRIQPPFSHLLNERLEHLQKTHKLSANADLLAIQSCIRDLAFTSSLFSFLLGTVEEKLALSNLHYFIKAFAAGIDKI